MRRIATIQPYICFLGIIIIFAFLNPVMAATETSVVAQPTYHFPKTILVVDFNTDRNANYKGFLTGKDALLLMQSDTNSLELTPDKVIESEAFLTRVFNENMVVSRATLGKYDPNQDTIIDQTNPIYDQLRVLVIEKKEPKGSQLTLMSLQKAGIKKIILDGSYVSLPPEQRNQKTQYVAGKLIMNDGTERRIYDVVMY